MEREKKEKKKKKKSKGWRNGEMGCSYVDARETQKQNI